MAYENIRLSKPNFTIVGGYYWTMDHLTDSLIVKTDDGTHAYSYPLDTTLTEEVVSLEYDGYNIWSLENNNDGSITIRRWYIDNYVCKIRNTFNMVGNAEDTFDSNAFTVEHYHVEFNGDVLATDVSLDLKADAVKPSTGMTLVLGPNQFGQMEECTVSSVTGNTVFLGAPLQYAYSDGDDISFYKTIWLFNNYYGTDGTTGALYNISAFTGSVVSKTQGGAYKDILACTFFDMSDVFGSGAAAICYVKAANMIFLNPNDMSSSWGSMIMDNIKTDQSTVIGIYDIAIEGKNVYRLQKLATYYGVDVSFANGSYNYQLSTLESFITSISMRANPAILPANGVNTSDITVVVKDQFNLPVVSKLVYFTEDDDEGIITLSPVNTDAKGEAKTVYRAGVDAREVRITATAQQG